MESMVPRARYDALQERLEAALAFHRAEADGMRRLVVAAAAAAAETPIRTPVGTSTAVEDGGRLAAAIAGMEASVASIERGVGGGEWD